MEHLDNKNSTLKSLNSNHAKASYISFSNNKTTKNLLKIKSLLTQALNYQEKFIAVAEESIKPKGLLLGAESNVVELKHLQLPKRPSNTTLPLHVQKFSLDITKSPINLFSFTSVTSPYYRSCIERHLLDNSMLSSELFVNGLDIQNQLCKNNIIDLEHYDANQTKSLKRQLRTKKYSK